MRPLTDHIPKTLLPVCGRPLIDYHLAALAASGHRDVVINIAYRGSQIVEYCTRNNYDLNLHFSDEGPSALETGGGIRHALPLLGSEPFLVINGDIHTDFPFTRMRSLAQALPLATLAHLVLVPNPRHRLQGDFALQGAQVQAEGPQQLTFSGIGLYRPALFAELEEGAFPLAPLLRKAMASGQVNGELYTGRWCDVGTPQRLSELETGLGC
jgi:N-acetyl-alpha-D-muramate 1-phosphate uridylyltransferase